MRKLVFAVLGLWFAVASGEAVAMGGQFYDPVTKKWQSYAPGGFVGGKSPVRRKRVRYETNYPVGTIVIDTSERRLYHVMENGRAMKYGVGVGKDGFQWAGTHRITRKAEWPGWTPPPEMRARERRKGRILPAHMPGGPNNPLGARALYIGSTLYRIHGTNQPWTIGSAVSSGCIRLANDDVKHLYKNVKVGSKVVVKR